MSDSNTNIFAYFLVFICFIISIISLLFSLNIISTSDNENYNYDTISKQINNISGKINRLNYEKLEKDVEI